MRQVIAERMSLSASTVPHAYIAREIDFAAVDIARAAAKAQGLSLTYLPFIAAALCAALKSYPALNAWYRDSELEMPESVNLGIAVDLDFAGLVVPVIHAAEQLSVTTLAEQIKDLATKARSKKLGLDAFAGGTITITNDGPFGTAFTVPIINQPQVAILATDGIKRRPVVALDEQGHEQIAIHPVGLVGMSFDHRAVDGAYVAAFLSHLAELLETTDWAAQLT